MCFTANVQVVVAAWGTLIELRERTFAFALVLAFVSAAAGSTLGRLATLPLLILIFCFFFVVVVSNSINFIVCEINTNRLQWH